VSNQLVDGTSLVFARVPSGRNRSQCLSENATPNSQHRVSVSHNAC